MLRLTLTAIRPDQNPLVIRTAVKGTGCSLAFGLFVVSTLPPQSMNAF
jgi:hypothetical protein